MKQFYTFSFLTLLFLVFSCDSPKKITKLKMLLPEAGSSVQKGQTFSVKLQVPGELSSLDSIQYTIDGQHFANKTTLDSILIDTQDLEFGQRTIGAKVFAKGQSESVFSNVIIVPSPPKKYGFRVLKELPHDPEAFTQGLEINKGYFYESTGQYDGRSSLRKVEISSGKVLQKINLADEYFGEGMTIIGNRIFQLTYMERKAFVYDLSSLKKLTEFTYDKRIKEGWGLSYDGTDLILTEGSNLLYFLNPADFSIKKIVPVFNHLGPVHSLNELEYIDGIIYANIYQSDIIVMIDPSSGAVIGEINLIGIYPDKNKRQYDNELNGIAFDSSDQSIYVTGKKWSKLFKIELVER